MVDFLLESSKRRDYRLKYKFGCPICKLSETHCRIYLHRTKREIELGRTHNINQICGNGHITKPNKYCTKCNKIYFYGKIICTNCETSVMAITRMELEVEKLDKEIKRISRTKPNTTKKEKELQIKEMELRKEGMIISIERFREEMSTL